MNSWVVVLSFIIIYALVVPWIVDWIILNKQNRKVSLLKSHYYLEKKFSNREKIIVELVMFLLIIVIMYGYYLLSINQFSQLYIILYLFLGIVIGFFINFLLKTYLLKEMI